MSYQIGLVKAGQEAADKTYSVRSVSPGEALALRGDFFAHHNDVERAQPVLQESVEAEPNLPFAHEALGYWHYRRHELEEADTENGAGDEAGRDRFCAALFPRVFLMQKGSLEEKTAQEAKQSLEKAAERNPQFAPAYEALAQAYAQLPNLQKTAVSAAIKAEQLDPGQHAYAINLAYLLVNGGRFAQARTMAQRILASASSSGEKEVVNNLLANLQHAEQWSAKKPSADTTSVASGDSAQPNSTVTAAVGPTIGQRPAGTSQLSSDAPGGPHYRGLGADGPITSVECSSKPEAFINVSLGSGPGTFHASDIRKVSLKWADGTPEPTMNTCSQWKGRRIKVWFRATPGKEYAGEIIAIYFF